MLARAIVLSVTLLCGAGIVARASRPEQPPARTSFAEFPFRLGAWAGQELPPLDTKILGLLGVDDYLNRAYYRSDQTAAGFYVGYYRSQREGDAIHSPVNCLPGAGWEPLTRSYLPIAVAGASGPAMISVNRYVVQKGLDRQLVLYWYQSHGRVVANEYWSKLFLVRDAMRLNRTDAALVRIIVPIAPNAPDADARAEDQAVDFVHAVFPLLPGYIPS